MTEPKDHFGPTDSMLRVQLTPEEVTARAKELAHRMRERDLLVEDFTEIRKGQKQELETLDRSIRRLADAVRTGYEDRTRQVGLFTT
jgi:hypothetical protein